MEFKQSPQELWQALVDLMQPGETLVKVSK
jgi:hypothetical protein